jgi:hypothetical protein
MTRVNGGKPSHLTVIDGGRSKPGRKFNGSGRLGKFAVTEEVRVDPATHLGVTVANLAIDVANVGIEAAKGTVRLKIFFINKNKNVD